VQKAYLDQLSVTAARSALTAAVNNGAALTSYVGHSGLTAWTFKSLFTTTHAKALTNAGKPTVVTQWGCWNTYYVAPKYDTLGHVFLISGDRGAAAVFGASALTEATSEDKLGRELMPRLVQPGMSLGTSMQQAKAQLGASEPQLIDVLLGWTLLGDPALVIEK